MQWHRDQHIRSIQMVSTDVLTQQMTQHSARRELTVELECLHQAIGGKFVSQWENRMREERCLRDAGATDTIIVQRQWQTTPAAMGPWPWQVGITAAADTDRSGRQAAQNTAWWKQVIENRLPPACVALQLVFGSHDFYFYAETAAVPIGGPRAIEWAIYAQLCKK